MFPPSNAPRQNEYFVPRDGIDREVITADICRYLGNDALVRPGTHNQVSTLARAPQPLRRCAVAPLRPCPFPACTRLDVLCADRISCQQDGRPIQGYYITAYRNLTSVCSLDR